ncbi:adenosylcobinamide-GDP ribazoletransferase [Hoeflea prorocentri]|uniref:Adenosylcobinamide-GDP ribazoletransferase n=1 Tax=Hoeflea prorocentri TaxID=1922333 RepID=A0A9X3ZGX3_9HYPH|nr:adenosylcobinamide-GDP ribazoletransferase [Hoeflea prorocentri]MCY6380266.1 adenosylcobinamide-GDP ribazoletransferase [Hoeflea prorocentri]MDA5398066.1 adenosylcobinamide-GDP ribazoletransferase [Hoeflea prorocentri]
MDGIVTETARAVAFLSRLPVPDRFFAGADADMTQSARTYPLAGMVVALPAALLLFMLLFMGLPPLFAAGLAVTCQMLTTGGLHEDGLADCADGFGAGGERERILAVMKDSTIGTFGGLALILSVVLRVAGLATIASAVNPLGAALALLSVSVASRGAMVWHWHSLPAARPDGVAVSIGRPDEKTAVFAAVSGALLTAVLAFPAGGLAGAITSLFLVAIVCSVFVRMTEGRIGGHTGDTIGATQQICEIAALLGLALWVQTTISG